MARPAEKCRDLSSQAACANKVCVCVRVCCKEETPPKPPGKVQKNGSEKGSPWRGPRNVGGGNPFVTPAVSLALD